MPGLECESRGCEVRECKKAYLQCMNCLQKLGISREDMSDVGGWKEEYGTANMNVILWAPHPQQQDQRISQGLPVWVGVDHPSSHLMAGQSMFNTSALSLNQNPFNGSNRGD